MGAEGVAGETGVRVWAASAATGNATAAIVSDVSARMGVIYTDLTPLKSPSETMAPMTIHSALTHAEAARPPARLAGPEPERTHLLGAIESLKAASGSVHCNYILNATAPNAR